ncbi:hypothetical protein [Spiroplasma endosymbiont of Atherix ibis]|uniref:hypothetical protein n=1 Tax=Spiroplasma endosymbiont of Atherix ibis TaxID=3066291 RepID=UPI0030CBBB3C
MSFKKIKTYQLLDASTYYELIFNSIINVNKYQKSLLTSLNSNELMIKQLSNYNDIKFRISSNKITINQVKNSDSVNIIILILLVFLLTILLIFFIEFLSYLKYRILNNNFVVKNFVKDIFKYLKK